MEENLNESTPISLATNTSPVNIDTSDLDRPKSKFLLPTIIAIILFVLVTGSVAGFYQYNQQNSKMKALLNPSPTSALENNDTLTSSTVLPTSPSPSNAPLPPPDEVPQENTLYLTKNPTGEQSIFYTNKEEQRVFNSANVETRDEYKGEIRSANGVGSEVNYKTLISPRKLFAVPDPILGVQIKANQSDENLYIAVTTYNGAQTYPDSDETIYRYNLKSNTNQQVWKHVVGSTKYPNAGGNAGIEQIVDNNYLVLPIDHCYACEPAQVGIIIVNITTGKETYLQDIGDVEIKPKENVFTYKKLAEFKEPCDPGYGCDDNGQRSVDKPSGPTLTAKLP